VLTGGAGDGAGDGNGDGAGVEDGAGEGIGDAVGDGGPAVDDGRVGGCVLPVVVGVIDDVAGDGSVGLGAEVVDGACVGGAVGRAVGAAVGAWPGRPPLTVQWGDGQLLAGWPGHQVVNLGSLHQALREQSVWCTQPAPGASVGAGVGGSVGAGGGVGAKVPLPSTTRTSAQFLNCSPHSLGGACTAGQLAEALAPPHHATAFQPLLAISLK